MLGGGVANEQGAQLLMRGAEMGGGPADPAASLHHLLADVEEQPAIIFEPQRAAPAAAR